MISSNDNINSLRFIEIVNVIVVLYTHIFINIFKEDKIFLNSV